MQDFFNARETLETKHGTYTMFRLDALEKAGLTTISRLPFSIRVMLEAALRQCNDREITRQDVKNIAAWGSTPTGLGVIARPGIPFLPARVVMQDFTGVPAVVDLAAGGRPEEDQPACARGPGDRPLHPGGLLRHN